MENLGEGCRFVCGFCYFNMAEISRRVEYLVAGVDRVGNKLVCLRRLDEGCIKGGSVVDAELDFVNNQMSVIHWGFEVRLTD